LRNKATQNLLQGQPQTTLFDEGRNSQQQCDGNEGKYEIVQINTSFCDQEEGAQWRIATQAVLFAVRSRGII
jgi:hypothetical protein